MPVLPDVLLGGPVELHRLTSAYTIALVDAISESLPDLGQWFPWAQTDPNVEDQRQRSAEADRKFGTGEDFVFVLIQGETRQLVGSLRLDPLVGVGTAGNGYWVRSNQHRRGYASAAVRAASSAAFKYLPAINLLEIQMDQANEASAGVPRKLGYVLDREIERERLAPKHTGRGFVWVMARERWEGING